MDQQRLEQRVPMQVLAKIASPEQETIGYVQNLSASGLAFRANNLFHSGDDVAISLHVPNTPTMYIKGLVVWNRNKPFGRNGQLPHGVKLLKPSSDYSKFVAQTLAGYFGEEGSHATPRTLDVNATDVLDILDPYTEDLRGGALLIKTDRSLTIGTRVELAIRSEQSADPIFCMTEVESAFARRWKNTNERTRAFGAAMKIVSISNIDAERLRIFLKRLHNVYNQSIGRSSSEKTDYDNPVSHAR